MCCLEMKTLTTTKFMTSILKKNLSSKNHIFRQKETVKVTVRRKQHLNGEGEKAAVKKFHSGTKATPKKKKQQALRKKNVQQGLSEKKNFQHCNRT